MNTTLKVILFWLMIIWVIIIHNRVSDPVQESEPSQTKLLSAKFMGGITTLDNKCYKVYDTYELKKEGVDGVEYVEGKVELVDIFGECELGY